MFAIIFCFGRNRGKPADQKQQQANNDEGGNALNTAAVGKLDQEEFDDYDAHQRRACHPVGTLFQNQKYGQEQIF